MPQDTKSGVYYELHGQGTPLFLGFPLFASQAEIFGEAGAGVLSGFLGRLTDRYRVLVADYPSIGRSTTIPPEQFTADRAMADMLSVADAAGFGRFAWFGYSVGAAIGLQLATRTDRLAALAIGGWTPLGGQYEDMRRLGLVNVDNPPPHARVVLRSPGQYRQWSNFWGSLVVWPEQDAVPGIRCPRLAFAGANADADINAGTPTNGIEIHYAATLRERRREIEALGWRVELIEGHGHAVGLDPAVAAPLLRGFLDDALPDPRAQPAPRAP